jgi:hypothetical protein
MIEFFGLKPSVAATEEAPRGAASMSFKKGNGYD